MLQNVPRLPTASNTGRDSVIYDKLNINYYLRDEPMTISHIGHAIENPEWRRSLQDVKADRGADIGSDHVLVVATVSLKLRKTKRGEERQQRFDTAKLNNSNTEKAFKLELLKKRFHVLQEEQEMNIDTFNQVLTETSKSLLGYMEKMKAERIKTDRGLHGKQSTKEKKQRRRETTPNHSG